MQKLFVVGLVLAAMSAALAMPSIYGPSGGFYVPSTSVQDGVYFSATMLLEESESEWPVVMINYGLLPNLEIGGGYFNWGDDPSWAINAKFLLPWTLGKGSLAIAGAYLNFCDGSETSINGQIVGTWPLSEAVRFTGGFSVTGGDQEQNSILLSLVRSYDNGVELGLEYITDMNCCLGWDDYIDADDSFATIYVGFPIAENLAGRFIVNGITSDNDMAFIAQLGGKF